MAKSCILHTRRCSGNLRGEKSRKAKIVIPLHRRHIHTTCNTRGITKINCFCRTSKKTLNVDWQIERQNAKIAIPLHRCHHMCLLFLYFRQFNTRLKVCVCVCVLLGISPFLHVYLFVLFLIHFWLFISTADGWMWCVACIFRLHNSNFLFFKNKTLRQINYIKHSTYTFTNGWAWRKAKLFLQAENLWWTRKTGLEGGDPDDSMYIFRFVGWNLSFIERGWSAGPPDGINTPDKCHSTVLH